MLRLTSPLARALARAFGVASQPSLRIAGAILRRISRFTAASLGLHDEVLLNAEERRSGDLEGESCERKGVRSGETIRFMGGGVMRQEIVNVFMRQE
jgi:hypothetical protein